MKYTFCSIVHYIIILNTGFSLKHMPNVLTCVLCLMNVDCSTCLQSVSLSSVCVKCLPAAEDRNVFIFALTLFDLVLHAWRCIIFVLLLSLCYCSCLLCL